MLYQETDKASGIVENVHKVLWGIDDFEYLYLIKYVYHHYPLKEDGLLPSLPSSSPHLPPSA